MGVIAGIILDDSVLFSDQDPTSTTAPPPLRDGVCSLLRRLRYSNIPTGLSYDPGLSADKVSVLRETATLYSSQSFPLDASSADTAMATVNQVWSDIRGHILYIVSLRKKDACHNLSTPDWVLVFMADNGAGEHGSYITKLGELPLTICKFNKKAMNNNVVTVGYMMKASREDDFAKRGAFPMLPTSDGLMFLPLTFELPLASQLQEVDVILHKATDEIVSVELSSSIENSARITYTKGMEELQRYMEHHPDQSVIDPLKNIYPVLDRLKIQHILLGLEDLNKEGSVSIRGPHFLKVDDFGDPDLVQKLSEAKLSLPSIVKPQVACGVADAHSMAIVFRVEDFRGLDVPLPAVIQEYVNHSSTLFKFYVLGEKVFHAVKKSTPNADQLMKLSDGTGLIFDSLKSLPTGKQDSSKPKNDLLDLAVVTEAANWLRKKLELTIFGFDVVVQEGSGDHVMVDVNYLPSFKEVADDIAIPTFWEALKNKSKTKRQ
ncbi:hypothetical protein ACFE04_006065 [Oxalis oulophora]